MIASHLRGPRLATSAANTNKNPHCIEENNRNEWTEFGALAYSQDQLWDPPASAFSVLFYTSFTVKTHFLSLQSIFGYLVDFFLSLFGIFKVFKNFN